VEVSEVVLDTVVDDVEEIRLALEAEQPLEPCLDLPGAMHGGDPLAGVPPNAQPRGLCAGQLLTIPVVAASYQHAPPCRGRTCWTCQHIRV